MYPKLKNLIPIVFTTCALLGTATWVFTELKANKEIFKYKYACEAELDCAPYYGKSDAPECVSNYWGNKMQYRKDGGVFEPFNLNVNNAIECQCAEKRCAVK